MKATINQSLAFLGGMASVLTVAPNVVVVTQNNDPADRLMLAASRLDGYFTRVQGKMAGSNERKKIAAPKA